MKHTTVRVFVFTFALSVLAATNAHSQITLPAIGNLTGSRAGSYTDLWIANDNDFLQTVNDLAGNPIDNPNQFFVVGFTDADLAGSVYSPQRPRPLSD